MLIKIVVNCAVPFVVGGARFALGHHRPGKLGSQFIDILQFHYSWLFLTSCAASCDFVAQEGQSCEPTEIEDIKL